MHAPTVYFPLIVTEALMIEPVESKSKETLGAAMVGFGGWEMPLHYREGILREHLATRCAAGLFDVSHMGRLAIRGGEALRILQLALSNDASVLPLRKAQYTLIPTPDGGALDDAFLYRFEESEYIQVVNASNRELDLEHFRELLKGFPGAECLDLTEQTGMVSLQGPRAQVILQALLEGGALPEPGRGSLARARGAASELRIARTGYTGEPIGFELFSDAAGAGRPWDLLLERGAAPTGLGARDSLRLEAGLPLYGHGLGADPSGAQIPIFACPQGRLVGWVTSGTSLPYWRQEGQGEVEPGHGMRPIALALLDSRLGEGQEVEMEIRGRRAEALIVPRHLSPGPRGTARALLHPPS